MEAYKHNSYHVNILMLYNFLHKRIRTPEVHSFIIICPIAYEQFLTFFLFPFLFFLFHGNLLYFRVLFLFGLISL